MNKNQITTQRISSRRSFIFSATSLVATLLLTCSSLPAIAGKVPAGFSWRFAEVNGVRLHYFIGGTGSPVVLLHGYAETSYMWLPLMAELAKTRTVIAPDLRGFGQSSAPTNGYTKVELAQDVHALVRSLGQEHIRIVGHDIGLMEEAPEQTIPKLVEFLNR